MSGRILVVDDHAGIAERLRDDLIRAGSDVRVATSTRAAVELLKDWRPDVVVLDIEFAGEAVTGFDLLQSISSCSSSESTFSKAKAIIYSMHDDPAIIIAARTAGAAGFLSKLSTSATIVRAVTAVADGLTWFAEETPTGAGGLTPRQLEVVRCFVSGMSKKEAATALGLSEDTVAFHLKLAKKRTGARSMCELVSIAHKRGWLFLPGSTGRTGPGALPHGKVDKCDCD